MRIIFGFENAKDLRSPVLTMGSFDGVHAGHRELLRRVVDKAKKEDKDSVVLSFSPHPRMVLSPDNESVALLNSLEEKALLLEQIGIDILLVIPFTLELSEVSSESFLRDYLLGILGVSAVVVGFNHHFGHNKEGSAQTLTLSDEIEIVQVPKKVVGQSKVSSTHVRKLISAGLMSDAADCLTQPYFVLCKVSESGELILDNPHKLMPKDGCYPVRVKQGDCQFNDVLIVKNKTYRLTELKNNAPKITFLVQFL